MQPIPLSAGEASDEIRPAAPPVKRRLRILRSRFRWGSALVGALARGGCLAGGSLRGRSRRCLSSSGRGAGGTRSGKLSPGGGAGRRCCARVRLGSLPGRGCHRRSAGARWFRSGRGSLFEPGLRIRSLGRVLLRLRLGLRLALLFLGVKVAASDGHCGEQAQSQKEETRQQEFSGRVHKAFANESLD